MTHASDAYAPLYPFFPDWQPRKTVPYWRCGYGADTLWAVQLSAAGLILVWVLAKRAGDPRRAVRDGTGSRAGREIGKDG